MSKDSHPTRPKMNMVKNLESDFIEWLQNKSNPVSESTAETYWNRIKNLPYFDIFNWSEKPYYECELDTEKIKKRENVTDNDDVQEVLIGFLIGTIEDPHQQSVVNQYMSFLLDQAKNDDMLGDRMTTQLLTRVGNTKRSLNEMDFGNNTKPNIEEHYLHKDSMIDLLKEASPERARYWTLLYLLGCRRGELQRLEPEDIFGPEESDEDHGHVYIPDEKSKSKEARRIPFMTPLTMKLLEKAPTGISQQDGIELEEAYFPEVVVATENYHLGREYNEDGKTKIRGLIAKIDSIEGTRTLHSFRHIRVTDLLNDDYYDVSSNDVQKRTGHSNFSTTKHYEEAGLRRKPRGLESYWSKNCKRKDNIWEAFIEEVIEK